MKISTTNCKQAQKENIFCCLFEKFRTNTKFLLPLIFAPRASIAALSRNCRAAAASLCQNFSRCHTTSAALATAHADATQGLEAIHFLRACSRRTLAQLASGDFFTAANNQLIRRVSSPNLRKRKSPFQRDPESRRSN